MASAAWNGEDANPLRTGETSRGAGNESEGDRMSPTPSKHSEEHLDLVFLFALQCLSPREMASVEAQILSCDDCRQEIETLRPIVRSFVGWSTDVLRPAESLWGRLATRIARGTATRAFVPPLEAPVKPEWEEVAPGIHVTILARNAENDSVSMLVRLDPGTDYPAHTHAGIRRTASSSRHIEGR